jgi:hypothetical protein
MRKPRNPYWYNGPRVRQELRYTQDCPYSRRSRINDLKYCLYDGHGNWPGENWKGKRKQQHREYSRGEKHGMVLSDNNWRRIWSIKQYLTEHNIPFKIEDICERQKRKQIIRTERVKDYLSADYVYRWQWDKDANGKKTLMRYRSHQCGFSWKYKEVTLDKPKVRYYNVSIRVAYNLTWWSDKDIGMDFILNRIEL